MPYTKQEFIDAYAENPESVLPRIIARIKETFNLKEKNISVKTDLQTIFNLYIGEVRYEVEDGELECISSDDDRKFTKTEILNAIFNCIENPRITSREHYSRVLRPGKLTDAEWDSLIEDSLNELEYWNNSIAIFKRVDADERDMNREKAYWVEAYGMWYDRYLDDLDELSEDKIVEVAKLVLESNEEN